MLLNNPIKYIDPSGHKAGDLFDTQHDAAINFAMIYATEKESVEKNFEWGTYIYIDENEKYSYLDTIHGEAKEAGKQLTLELPIFYKINDVDGREYVAAIHTHGAYDGPSSVKFSVEDFNWSNRRITQLCPLYLANQVGELLYYDPNGFNPENEEEGYGQMYLIKTGLPKVEGAEKGITGFESYIYKKRSKLYLLIHGGRKYYR